MALQKKKTRMYEPWGYQDENNYQGTVTIIDNDLASFFAKVNYNKDDNEIHFFNKDGLEVGTLDVAEFEKSDKIVERAWYEDGFIYIKFTNGDLVTIDVKELLDENEFADGLQVVDGVVSVLRDSESERWLTVSSTGVKVSGIQAEIDRLDERVDNEIERATTREDEISSALTAEITRSIRKDVDHDTQLNIVDQRLDLLEVQVPAEVDRATNKENELTSAVERLQEEIDAIVSGSTPDIGNLYADAEYVWDNTNNKMVMNFYNKYGVKKKSLDIFRTNNQGNILIDGGTF